MRYISPRNLTLASKCGRSVELVKGVPQLCPPGMHDELLALGCVPEEEVVDPVIPGKAIEPTSLVERHAALCAAFEAISLRNERTDFNAAGVPHPAVLAKELGWSCPSKDRDAAWAKWQNETARK